MNSGIIASRYAAALLKLVNETGSAEVVASQVRRIQKALVQLPEFRRALQEGGPVPDGSRMALFETALEGEQMAPDLRKFLNLLAAKGRICYADLVFNSFLTAWRAASGIVSARVVVAVEDEDTGLLVERVRTLITRCSGCKVELETALDPSILGGFVLEVEDRLLDASVSRQLDLIRRQFVERNRRLV